MLLMWEVKLERGNLTRMRDTNNANVGFDAAAAARRRRRGDGGLVLPSVRFLE